MTTESFWRQQSNAVIAPLFETALAEGWDEARFRGELRDAYPFGERARWPYQVWLDCQRKAVALFLIATGQQPSGSLEGLPLFEEMGTSR